MQTICTSLQTDNYTSTRHWNFLQAGCCFWCPTNSVKALKATTQHLSCQSNQNWSVHLVQHYVIAGIQRRSFLSVSRYFSVQVSCLLTSSGMVSKNVHVFSSCKMVVCVYSSRFGVEPYFLHSTAGWVKNRVMRCFHGYLSADKCKCFVCGTAGGGVVAQRWGVGL